MQPNIEFVQFVEGASLKLFREKSQYSYSLPGFGNENFDVASKRQFGGQYDSKKFSLLKVFTGISLIKI